MHASVTRVRIGVVLVGAAILAVAGIAFAVTDGGGDPRARAIPTTTRLTTTTVVATTTLTTTTATTTTTIAPTTVVTTAPVAPATVVAPAPAGPAPATAIALGTLRGRTIVIDPGHDGGNASHASEISRPVFIGTQTRACDTTGTQTDGGYAEAEYTLDVAFRLRAVLQAAGASVVMTRETNDGWGPCIDERAAIGNRANADAVISVHADGGPAGGRGFHVLVPALVPGYTDDIYSASRRLGVDVRDTFLATGMPISTYYATQGLAERTDLGGLNLSNVPKVFVETGNMRNATDAALLESVDFRQRAAQALAVGLDRYL